MVTKPHAMDQNRRTNIRNTTATKKTIPAEEEKYIKVSGIAPGHQNQKENVKTERTKRTRDGYRNRNRNQLKHTKTKRKLVGRTLTSQREAKLK